MCSHNLTESIHFNHNLRVGFFFYNRTLKVRILYIKLKGREEVRGGGVLCKVLGRNISGEEDLFLWHWCIWKLKFVLWRFRVICAKVVHALSCAHAARNDWYCHESVTPPFLMFNLYGQFSEWLNNHCPDGLL